MIVFSNAVDAEVFIRMIQMSTGQDARNAGITIRRTIFRIKLPNQVVLITSF